MLNFTLYNNGIWLLGCLAIWLNSCAYSAKKELEKTNLAYSHNNSKYLKLHLQTTIDLMISDLPDRNYAKLLQFVDTMYISVKYSNVKNRKVKKVILSKIKDIKTMIVNGIYNRALLLKLEQLKEVVQKIY